MDGVSYENRQTLLTSLFPAQSFCEFQVCRQKYPLRGGRCHQLAKASVFISVGMFPIGECIFCYKGPRKSYVSMTSNEASVFHSDERYRGESDRKENRMRSIENHCVRHSAGSYPSGEISETDVHSHTRSNKGHRMYCFGELRTHHTSILASTSSYRQPRFAPHSIRKGHLEHTHRRERRNKHPRTRTPNRERAEN